MLPAFPQDVFVIGNVNPVGYFLNGTVESISVATQQLLAECAGYPNFVPSSGCDIPPMAPWENMDAFFGAVHAFYA